MTDVYFNEIDEVACAVLREVYGGHVDGRSIKDVGPADIRPFRRAHFFAGAGLWETACGLAGWPDARHLWSASCPCQPFSAAGKGLGTDDPRHLWPHLFRLVDAERPPIIVGEQVAGKAGDVWLDGVCADLEGIGYTCWAVEVPASAVDSPQKRSRNWWVAMASTDSRGRGGWSQSTQRGAVGRDAPKWVDGAVEHATHGPGRECGKFQASQRSPSGNESQRREWSPVTGSDERSKGDVGGELGLWISSTEGAGIRIGETKAASSFWAEAEWLDCADGKKRRTPIPESYFCNVAHGLSGGIERFDPACLLVQSFKGRAEAWKLAGNAIVPWVAAQILASILEA
jgi:DNA (cytosine-5)-methyltransferase 1